jgi:CheY-like chemotaxis protein/lipopolysaccharide biosynthesis regulator YciM
MTRLLYPDIGRCRALIIDGNPTSRSLLAMMLRQMGVGQVVQTSRALDARRQLENRVFDIVLCDYHFDHSAMSGQDLLDDLRRAQLLPYTTVFVMVTGEASYTRVAEAAEAALDSYLLKPHTATQLETRLLQARHRKQVLKTIFDAIEAGDFLTAAQHCRVRFEARGEYWLYAARIGAELFVRQGDHHNARALYEAVQAAKALPWARLGIARVELESGQLQQACRTLESLIGEQPTYADAYDVMGRVQVEQGDMDAALETYRNAARLTPASITRLQKQGMLSFYMGQTADAVESLERTVRIGIRSKMFDGQTLVLLALLYFDQRDTKAFGRNFNNMALAAERHPQSMRLRRFVGLGEMLKALIERRVNDAIRQASALAAEVRSDDFDFEAGSNLIAGLARLRCTEIDLPDGEQWISAVAQRFCVSKAATDMMCMAARSHEPYATIVRQGHQGISGMAEKAMTHSVTGSPEAAVKALMAKGSETLNAKLIDLAGLVLQRHATRIADSEGLGRTISDLRTRYCTKGTQVALGTSAGRAPGGLTIRS